MKSSRAVVLAFGATQITLYAGAIYGWPSLRLLLQDDGMYADQTDKDRALSFALVFAVGSAFAQAARLPIGFFLDLVSPRASSSLALFCTSLGAVLFALSDPDRDLLIPALSFIGFGGAGIQLSVQPLARLVPGHESVVVLISSGLFNLSTLMFLLFYFAADGTSVTRAQLFWAYAALALLFLALVVVLPPPNEPEKASVVASDASDASDASEFESSTFSHSSSSSSSSSSPSEL